MLIFFFKGFPCVSDDFYVFFSFKGEFEKFGMVSDVYNTGKGYAFVTFDRKEDADTAMDAMDGQTILGQQIKVGEEGHKQFVKVVYFSIFAVCYLQG